MKIEINDKYIDWIKEGNPDFSQKDIEDYIDEVLNSHKKSWDGFED